VARLTGRGGWVASIRNTQSRCTNVANRVGTRPHRSGAVSDGVLAHTIGARTRTRSTRTLSATVSGPRGWGRCHMQLLLMPQQQITASEASCAIGAFKGLFLGVRALMTFQVLQSREGATASGTDMRPWLVCLGRGDIAIGAVLAIGLGLLLSLLRRGCRWKKKSSEFVGKTCGELNRQGCRKRKHLPGMFPGISLILARSTNCGLWSRSWPTIASSSIIRRLCLLIPGDWDQCTGLELRRIGGVFADVLPTPEQKLEDSRGL
jgi:hypothetical protein